MDLQTRDWAPFRLAEVGEKPLHIRSVYSIEGIGDRLRAAAFAEVQARDGFLWASERFTDVPEGLIEGWKKLALEEEKHLQWLLQRARELGIDLTERPVVAVLWKSFMACQTGREFAVFMANAEERGKRAGERFYDNLKEKDPITAEIFRKIAEEEAEHIALVRRYYPDEPAMGKI